MPDDDVAGNAAAAVRAGRRAGWAFLAGGAALLGAGGATGVALFGAVPDGPAGLVLIGIVLLAVMSGLAALVAGGAMLRRARTIHRALAWAPLRPAGAVLTGTVTLGAGEHREKVVLAAVGGPGSDPLTGQLRPLWPGWSTRTVRPASPTPAWASGPVQGRSVVAVDEGRSVAVLAPPGDRRPALVEETLRRLALALPKGPLTR